MIDLELLFLPSFSLELLINGFKLSFSLLGVQEVSSPLIYLYIHVRLYFFISHPIVFLYLTLCCLNSISFGSPYRILFRRKI